MAKIKGTAGSSAYLGYKPTKLIPESEKNEVWMAAMADWIIETTDGSDKDYEKQFAMFNGERDNSQLDYITKTFGIDFPAKIKHIPLIRPKLNILIGEEQERGLEFDINSQDESSLEKRKSEILNYVIRRYIQLVREEITEEEFEKDEQYLRRSYKTSKEIAIYHMVKEYIMKHRLHEELSDSFINKIITGEEKGRVRLGRVGEDPIFESIPPNELRYSTNRVKWLSSCDWVVRRKSLSITEILDMYGEELSAEEQEELFQQRESYGRAVKISHNYNMDTAMNDVTGLDYDATSMDSDLYYVYEMEFKSIRTLYVKEAKDKYDKLVIKAVNEEEYQSLSSSKKKKVSKRYVEDLYRITRIGEDKYVRYGKVKHPERDATQPSKVYLTFEGLTYSGPIKPYSLVKQTWDLQMLYDIMHFHKENLIAMSGTKGAVMDLAMLPDFGFGNGDQDAFTKQVNMYMYYKKMGVMFVDSSKRKANNGFNQTGNYDDTLGTGMNVILGVIQHLEETAGNVINMNRQRQGNVQNRDGKSTNEQAIAQSGLGTEPIFNEHDDFKDRILTKIVNLLQVSYAKGKTGSYVNENFEQFIFSLHPEDSMGDMGIYIINRMRTKRTVEALQMAAQNYAMQGLIPFEHVIDLLTTGSLKEMQVKLKESIKEQQDKVAQQQQQQAQFEQQLAAAQNQADQAKLMAELEKIRADIAVAQQEIALKEKEVDGDLAYKNASLALEAKRVELEAIQLTTDPKSAEVRND